MIRYSFSTTFMKFTFVFENGYIWFHFYENGPTTNTGIKIHTLFLLTPICPCHIYFIVISILFDAIQNIPKLNSSSNYDVYEILSYNLDYGHS